MRKYVLPHRKFWASVLLSAGLASIALIGGFGIQAVQAELIAFTPLLIALPAMNAITGDYATLIAAHIGDPEIYKQRLKKLFISLAISMPISIVGITAMSLFVASLQGFEIYRGLVFEYVTLVGIALVSILAISIASIFIINQALINRRVNSDDVLIPVANTIASVLVLISFAFIALRIN